MGNVSKIQFIDFILEDFQLVESCQRPFVWTSEEALVRQLFLVWASTIKGNGGWGYERSTRLHQSLAQLRWPKHLPNPSVSDATKYFQLRCSPRVSTLARQSYLVMMRRLVFSSCFLNFFIAIFTSLSLPDFPDSTLINYFQNTV